MKYILYAIIFLLSLEICVFIGRMIYHIVKGHKLPKIGNKCKKTSIFKRLFVHLPLRFCDDLFSKSDYEFNEQGFHLFVGEQGSGKTISLVYLLMRMRQKYPKVKIRTNMSYLYEDGEISDWRDLVFVNNGVYGQIDVIDEVQNWFNSLQSKDFPPEMFQEITQQRKQRKCIYGTSQVWNRVAKPIREQVNYVYKPMTLFGCLTIVRKYKPKVDDNASLDKLLLRDIFFFIHNDEIRNSFDTYKKIAMQSLKGFKSEDKHIRRYAPAESAGGNDVVSR